MYITVFSVHDKEYGVEVSQISEVIRLTEVTPVPDSADFVEGVITFRDHVIPVVNLKKKLGLEPFDYPTLARILIIPLSGGSFVGVMADEVRDVLVIEPEQMEPAGDYLKEAVYLKGVVKLGERIILIADPRAFLDDSEQSMLREIHDQIKSKKK